MSGSLYLRDSMSKDDSYLVVDSDIDPSSLYCIGPAYEPGWYVINDAVPPTNQEPWRNLSSLGYALVEREMARIKRKVEEFRYSVVRCPSAYLCFVNGLNPIPDFSAPLQTKKR
ncbi:hypothetical protein B0J11DRAFT_537317 [Dendryphion nanum]|uniref:Uncharacterized protein n=1 Tax=Dendryphion nanum TaxID=256645 RepID=A0A9P9DC89_9PLEO|nr:hypothetical protein B0J11DRAFT_537317 [Dendryphion nanum]